MVKLDFRWTGKSTEDFWAKGAKSTSKLQMNTARIRYIFPEIMVSFIFVFQKRCRPVRGFD